MIKYTNLWKHVQSIIILLIFMILTVFLCFLINMNVNKAGYSVFIEFNSAYGIREGTNIRMRGVNIGYVKKIKIDLNSILLLVSIKSTNILIPKNSIVETNQTGLLNETVIDIVPLDLLRSHIVHKINVFSEQCYKSSVVCHLNCIQGERGLNYDDLVRAATRISQRFDDPGFFNIFYLFLQNSIDLSDDILKITFDTSNVIFILYNFLKSILLNYT
uniref:hypothetical protein n=1 Tax=Hypnea edeniana TaxID=1524265 RepID=UPI0023F2C8C7|nr:hypothetical protein P8482_pgp101 [Hypnea edeniana]WCH54689.1 hypothetical protein [Hypnea edeniana]WDY85093.1 hypothetical protein [Hypnea edeniana]